MKQGIKFIIPQAKKAFNILSQMIKHHKNNHKLALVLLLLAPVTLKAQVKIGMRLTPQLTWATSDNRNTFSNASRINASYGLMVDYYFADNYAIGTEFGIHAYGTNLNVKRERHSGISHNGNNITPSANVNYDYRLQYFQLPLLIKMRTNEIGYFRYYAEFGGVAGILSRARATVNTTNFRLQNVNVNNPDVDDEYKFIDKPDFYDDVNWFRLGLCMGAGIQYNFMGNSLLQVGIRYEDGLSSFTKADSWKTSINYVGLNFGVIF
jgi:opacity protein-like surface antigen